MRAFLVSAVFVGVCFLPVTAAADTITQSVGFSGIPNFEDTLTFDQFDDSGGALTLQSIKVTVTLDVTGGQLILDNDGLDPASGTFEFGGKTDISSTDVSLLDAALQPVTGELSASHSEGFSLAANQGDGPNDFDGSPPDGLIYNGGSETDSDFGYVGSASWSTGATGFIGTGTYDIILDADQWQDYGAVGGIEFAVTPVSASGTVEIIYTYIPEPTTMLLLSAVGVPVLLKRRRR